MFRLKKSWDLVSPEGVDVKNVQQLVSYWMLFVERELWHESWISLLHSRTVLDIGYNYGQFSSLCFSLCPSATVIGFDPLPEVVFSKKLAGWFRTALGSYTGTTVLNVSDAVGLTASTDPEIYADASRKIAVPLATLDSLSADIFARSKDYRSSDRAPRFVMKLDVDGSECLVLKGGRSILQFTDVVIVECMDGPYRELVEAELNRSARTHNETSVNRQHRYYWKCHKVGNIDYVYTREPLSGEITEVDGTVDGVVRAFGTLVEGQARL